MKNKELIEVLDYEIEQLIEKIKKARDNDNFGTYKNLILSLKEILKLKSEENEMSYYLISKDNVIAGVSDKNNRNETIVSKDMITCKFDSKISEAKYIPDISKIVLALYKIENSKQHEISLYCEKYQLEVESKYYEYVRTFQANDRVIISNELYCICSISINLDGSSRMILKRI